MATAEEVEPRRRSSSSKARTALLVLPGVLFVALLAFGLLRSAPARLAPGAPAPAFSLPLLDGGTLSSSDLRGHPVVVNFWASWCEPCKEEAELLERAWRDYRDDGVVFVGVNIQDARDEAEAFVDRFDITYPIVRDETEALARKLAVYGIPETFFIDDEGLFLASIAGPARSEREGTVVLGAISPEQLFTNLDLLVARAASSPRPD
ncbi:MAG: TlpA disulfide reductase family protein [Actinomycetota bacterium]